MKSKLKKTLRYYFSRFIENYMMNGVVSNKHIDDCLEDIIKDIIKDNVTVVEKKYKLLSNQQGLYHQTNKMICNPCFVVGGGNSLKNFKFDKLINKTTIVSNKALLNVPNSNYFITTDYTFLNWLKKENKYKHFVNNECMKFFVANCISDAIQNKNGVITDTRYDLKYKLEDFDKIVICKSAKSIGFDFNNFNSGYNSGFSSLQLAILLGYNPIYLLGMDMCNQGTETHYHGGYGKSHKRMGENLDNYLKHFKTILNRLKIEKPDLQIISCSDISLLNEVIPYQPIEEIIK